MIQDVLLQDIIISDRVASFSGVARVIRCLPHTYRADSCVRASCDVRRRVPNILQKGKHTNPYLKVMVACVVFYQKAGVALIDFYGDRRCLLESFMGGIPDGF